MNEPRKERRAPAKVLKVLKVLIWHAGEHLAKNLGFHCKVLNMLKVLILMRAPGEVRSFGRRCQFAGARRQCASTVCVVHTQAPSKHPCSAARGAYHP
jgi:hypothetical protein